jgi:AcrR family transcriptional regulator
MSVQDTPTTESPEKREAILAQAIATFAEEGFRHADVQVIADRAGVGKGTVYRYFGNKEDLFWASTFAVVRRLEEHLIQAMRDVDGALEKLRAVSRAYARFFEAHPHYLEIFVQERAEFRGSAPESHIEYHRKLIDRFAALIEEGIAAGEIRQVDVRRTIMGLGGLIYGSVVQACYATFDDALPDVALHAVDIFLEGLRAEGPADERGTAT